MNVWGRAWGDSWGLSWGLTYEANQEDLTAGPGSKGKSRKRVYVEREGRILVFDKPAQAAAYIEAEKVLEASRKAEAPKLKKIKRKQVKAVEPALEIQIDVLEVLAKKYALDYQDSLKTHDFESILSIYIEAQLRAEMEDEEEIEILLMAA